MSTRKVIQEMKITMRYHFSVIRLDLTNKADTNKFWLGYEETGTLIYCLWENKKCGAATLENNLAVPLNAKSRVTLRYLSKKTYLCLYKTLHINVHSSFIHIIASKWKQPKSRSTDEWINENIPYNGTFLAIKRNEVQMPHATIWFNLKNSM